jgi:hypothetical protein
MENYRAFILQSLLALIPGCMHNEMAGVPRSGDYSFQKHGHFMP